MTGREFDAYLEKCIAKHAHLTTTDQGVITSKHHITVLRRLRVMWGQEKWAKACREFDRRIQSLNHVRE